MSSLSDTNAPLSGITVIDLSRLLPGPMCSMHLADLGAEVIKIEDTGAGDYARDIGALTTKVNPLFYMVNRGKRSLSLDLSQQAGQAVLHRLVANADVVLETFRPGVAQRLHADYETLKQHKPDLVYCSISGYGQTGPWADRSGHDINYCAISGVLDQVGRYSEAPAQSNWQMADLAGGALSGFGAICAALVKRSLHGKGSYIDLSMTDAVFAHSVAALTAVNTFNQSPQRGADMLTGAMPGYDIYATRDKRYLAVGALEGKFWKTLCEAIERPDLVAQNLPGNLEAKQVLVETFAQHDLSHWQQVFDQVDCCVTPILSPQEATAHPQLQARNMIAEIDSPIDRKMIQPASPFRFNDYHKTDFSVAPAQGEHSREILKQFDYSEEEIVQLEKQQTINSEHTNNKLM